MYLSSCDLGQKQYTVCIEQEIRLIKRRFAVLAISALAMVSLIGVILTVTSPSAANANSETITYAWHACEPFFSGEEFGDDCPNTAFASNGDTIKIDGDGTLQVHPKAVTGGGNFKHIFADGSDPVEGTFEATQLLSFKTYGGTDDPDFGDDFRTGLANIRVELFDGDTKVGDGILRIGCRLPGVKLPPSLDEKIKLNVVGGPNFNKIPDAPVNEGNPPGGHTLFRELP